MKRIEKPENNIEDIITDCISNYENEELKKKFTDSILFIEDYTNLFDSSLLENSVHLLVPHDNTNNILSTKEMVNLYDNKFSKQKQPGRIHYEKIKISAPNEKCPLCGVRIVSTLDHFMSKKLFPTLAISPINLVPACFDCNKIKGKKQFETFEETHLHPYYDNIDDEIWLTADVTQDNSSANISIQFNIVKPANYDISLYQRITTHFILFELQRLFGIQAIDEILNVKYKLKKIRKTAGIKALYEDLLDTKNSCEKYDRNSWRSALYRALHDNKWFVETYLDD